MFQNSPFTFVTCIHGNEVKPLLALHSLNIPFLVGNPKAVELGTRFVDVDLNASFGRTGRDYEARRATDLLQQIPDHTTVIDFHTYSTNTSEPFVIIRDLGMKSLATIFGLPVVYMAYNPKGGHALIDHRKGLSIEVGKHDDADSFRTTSFMIQRLKEHKTQQVPLFQVTGTISEPGEYRDFQEINGFFPVLSNSSLEYKHWGFRAEKIQ